MKIHSRTHCVLESNSCAEDERVNRSRLSNQQSESLLTIPADSVHQQQGRERIGYLSFMNQVHKASGTLEVTTFDPRYLPLFLTQARNTMEETTFNFVRPVSYPRFALPFVF
jgi:hypothetical protein